jgi:GTP-binding protein Era
MLAHSLPLIDQLTAITEFDAVFMISALQYDGVEDVKDFLFSMSQRKPWEFDSADKSDLNPQEQAAEIIREKLYQRLNHELPYAVTQSLGEWRELGARACVCACVCVCLCVRVSV